MRVLIIGGAGLLGSHLVDALSEKEHDVAICDNFSGSHHFRSPRNRKIYTADVCNYNAINTVFNKYKPDTVVLAVNFYHSPEVVYKEYDDVRLIINAANNLASLLTPEIERVIYCSSYEIYGPPEPRKPVAESRKVIASCSPRGEAFRFSENILSSACSMNGIDFVGARIFDMYGPRGMFSPSTGKISLLIDYFLKGEPLGLVGGHRKRDFIHVEDAAGALVGLLSAGNVGPVNIGTGVGASLGQVCVELRDHIDGPCEVSYINRRDLSPFTCVANTTKLMSLLPGWSPMHTLKKDLSTLVRFRTSEHAYYDNDNSAQRLSDQRGLSSGR